MLQSGLAKHHRSRYARATRGLLVFLALATAALATAPAAMAWKPFAHNYIGYQAYNDAVAGCTKQFPCVGSVTIGGHSYFIDPTLADALYNEPAYFNAGVVGPDGFPDLAFGQSVIHPEDTGAWLEYIYKAAWAAPTAKDASGKLLYTPLEDKQILAFTYGFLTHAAGDMWGHTLINDFAGGLFPSLDEVKKSRDAALIALRHIVAEGYAGSATPGWDRTIGPRAQVCVGAPPTRGTNCKDISDDQTPAVRLAAPHKFLYNIFVSPDAKLPVPSRGPLLDFFFDSQTKAVVDAARLQLDADNHDCKHPASNCVGTVLRKDVSTLRGVKHVALTVWKCKPKPECARNSADARKDEDDAQVAKDLREWSDHIIAGLPDWTKFSLQIAQSLFDPQTRRDVQNDKCRNRGPDELFKSSDSGSLRRDKELRRDCENGIGLFSTIEYKTRDYVNNHLLAMLGYEDVAKTKSWWEELAAQIDDIVGESLNPIRWVVNTIEEKLAEYVKGAIRDATGIDIDQLSDFLHTPSRWMCGTGSASLTLPRVGKTPSGKPRTFIIKAPQLYSKAEHDRLDTIMGLPGNHHVPQSNIPADCGPLRPSTQYDPNRFAPIKDSITQAKLLLLDGPQLDHALSDVLVDAQILKSSAVVRDYQPGDNVMFTALGTPEPWLQLIDGDHAWRQDGLPRFCPVQACLVGPRPPGGFITTTRISTEPNGAPKSTGGTGRYPIWESCVLRPAFRALFTDWEDVDNFPDLGDATSPDPATAPNPPTVTATPAATTTTIDGKPFVLPGTSFTVTARDDIFTDAAIHVSYRAYAAGTTPGPFQPIPNGGTFALPMDTGGGDWVVETQVSDNCASGSGSLTVGIA